MPVEQRSGSSQVTSIIIGVVVVVLAVAATWGLLRLASGDDAPVKVRLGDDTFDAGQASRLAGQIAEEGPVLFSDVSGRGQLRPIWVNHFGDDPELQWSVFTATAPGAAEGCFLAWNAEENLFDVRTPDPDDPKALGELCNEDTYGVTGDGLEQFPWRIDDDGNLIIDLRESTDDSGGNSEGGGEADGDQADVEQGP
jgi:hypothetical protein